MDEIPTSLVNLLLTLSARLLRQFALQVARMVVACLDEGHPGGVANVRSGVCLLIRHCFKEAGITIPYPRWYVHLRQVTEPE